jgi:hypothetical protein
MLKRSSVNALHRSEFVTKPRLGVTTIWHDAPLPEETLGEVGLGFHAATGILAVFLLIAVLLQGFCLSQPIEHKLLSEPTCCHAAH